MSRKTFYPLLRDLVIIALSIAIAIVLVRTRVIGNILAAAEGFRAIGSFIAGIFYTSIFTTAPASVTLGTIALSSSLLETALLGGLGALVGDFLIFRFVRHSLSEHIAAFTKKHSERRHRYALSSKFARWAATIIGALIIASPLPDELGIFLLGFSKTNTTLFAVFSFLANSFGIFIIGIIAKYLA